MLVEQPAVFVPMTEYVVVVDGLTVMEDDVAPLLHTYDEAPLAVSVVDAPAQITDEDTLTFTEGEAFTVIVFETIAEHPPAFVPVQVYVVVELGLTVMLAEVAPLLHT